MAPVFAGAFFIWKNGGKSIHCDLSFLILDFWGKEARLNRFGRAAPNKTASPMSFLTRLFFSERKADQEYAKTMAQYEVGASATPEEIIQKIREAIDYLINKFWSGDRPKWLRIIAALGEFAGIVFQIIRAIIALLKQPKP